MSCSKFSAVIFFSFKTRTAPGLYYGHIQEGQINNLGNTRKVSTLKPFSKAWVVLKKILYSSTVCVLFPGKRVKANFKSLYSAILIPFIKPVDN